MMLPFGVRVYASSSRSFEHRNLHFIVWRGYGPRTSSARRSTSKDQWIKVPEAVQGRNHELPLVPASWEMLRLIFQGTEHWNYEILSKWPAL